MIGKPHLRYYASTPAPLHLPPPFPRLRTVTMRSGGLPIASAVPVNGGITTTARSTVALPGAADSPFLLLPPGNLYSPSLLFSMKSQSVFREAVRFLYVSSLFLLSSLLAFIPTSFLSSADSPSPFPSHRPHCCVLNPEIPPEAHHVRSPSSPHHQPLNPDLHGNGCPTARGLRSDNRAGSRATNSQPLATSTPTPQLLLMLPPAFVAPFPSLVHIYSFRLGLRNWNGGKSIS